MTAYVWPSRAEWQAKAEYSVRTFCTPSERLEKALPGADWSTLRQDVEMEELATATAKAVRPLLTAEITRLRALLPDRPPKSRARARWFVDLDDARYETATNLSALEGMRTSIARAVRAEHWHSVAWDAGRLYDHYPAVVLPEAVAKAVVRMRAIGEEIDARRTREADRLVEEAVAAEVALRATDAGWEKELRRRARIDGARNGVVIHRIGAAS